MSRRLEVNDKQSNLGEPVDEGSVCLPPRTFEFGTLAGDDAEVWIELSGITYRLRKTRQGKLILTK